MRGETGEEKKWREDRREERNSDFVRGKDLEKYILIVIETQQGRGLCFLI